MQIKIVRMNSRDVNTEPIGEFEHVEQAEIALVSLYGEENVLKQQDGTYDTLSKNSFGLIDHFVWEIIR